MSFFVDRFNRRKSPLALAAFGAALLDLAVFGLLYAFLAKPLNDAVSLGSAAATLVVQALIIAVLGTAVCCLLFLLKDKRVAPYGFLGLAVLLLVFYAVAFLLEEDQEMAVYSTEGRCMIFHTSALSPKTTRTTQGVNVMSLKPKYRVEKALPLAQTPIRNAARYRARSLPIAGALLREPDRGEEQMTLL